MTEGNPEIQAMIATGIVKREKKKGSSTTAEWCEDMTKSRVSSSKEPTYTSALSQAVVKKTLRRKNEWTSGVPSENTKKEKKNKTKRGTKIELQQKTTRAGNIITRSVSVALVSLRFILSMKSSWRISLFVYLFLATTMKK